MQELIENYATLLLISDNSMMQTFRKYQHKN